MRVDGIPNGNVLSPVRIVDAGVKATFKKPRSSPSGAPEGLLTQFIHQ